MTGAVYLSLRDGERLRFDGNHIHLDAWVLDS
jgi:hypothetical protein